MRTTGPRAFWLAFFITLGVVVPLLGSFALTAVWQKQDAAPAQQPQSGVPIRTPGPRHCGTALVAVAGQRPAFVLLRLDARENAVTLQAVPGESVLQGQSGPVLLAESYAAAGPARACALLSETLGIPIDRYLALTPDTLAAALEGAGSVRLNLTGLLSEAEQAALGLAGPVQEYDPAAAAAFLAGQDAALPPDRAGSLRAGLWEAYLRQNLERLPAALPDGLRGVSGRLLTDLSAEDLYTLAQTLDFLAGAGQAQRTDTGDALPGEGDPAQGGLRITAGVLPGHWDERAGRYEFTEETVALAAQLFGAAGEAEPEAEPESQESPVSERTPEEEAIQTSEPVQPSAQDVAPTTDPTPAPTLAPTPTPAPAEPEPTAQPAASPPSAEPAAPERPSAGAGETPSTLGRPAA